MTYVYFIRAIDNTGPIKIGSSVLPHHRLAQMSCWSPVRLTVLAKTQGDQFHERALHDKFADARSHGEWFEPVPELLALVDAVASGATLGSLGIEPSKCSTRSAKTDATRLKQGLTLRLNWALRAIAGHWTYTPEAAEKHLPDDVRLAVKQWRESTDVRPLTKQRQIIEAHIAHLKGLAA